MADVMKDLGPVSAYAVAVANGYTGTEQEWADNQANVALRADEAKRSAEASQQYAVDSQQSADNSKQSSTDSQQSADASDKSKQEAQQALADLLKMLGTDIPTLVDGKIPMSQIPATATQEIYEVTSEDELTGLVAQRGDLAELIEDINGAQTITKTWQLLGEDPKVKSNWILWGTSYAVQAGSATTAKNAENANTINNHRLIEITQAEWDGAVKDPDTYYLVFDPDSEVVV